MQKRSKLNFAVSGLDNHFLWEQVLILDKLRNIPLGDAQIAPSKESFGIKTGNKVYVIGVKL